MGSVTDSPLLTFRKSRGLSQDAAGNELGLSKSYLSKLENGIEVASLRLGLQIERWSGGVLRAEWLVSAEDRELLDRLPSALIPALAAAEAGA
jgi:transcriptional regulator with XRE-family HTH domain